MDDATNLETEVEELDETEAEEFESPDDESEVEETEEEEENEPENDEAEIEHDGQKYKVPAALKDSFLRQADYTQKTQALAETRKELENTLERAVEVSQKETAIESQFAINGEAIKQYQSIDWRAWMASDPAAANSARLDYDELKDQQQQLQNAHLEAKNERLALSQQETAKRLADGQKVLAEKIPGWGQDKANAILSFGQETYGLSAQELREIDDPRAILILHDAMQTRQAQKTAATVKKVETQQAVVPAAKVRGGSPPIKGLSDKLGAEEWARRRNEQVAKRNKG